MKRVIRRMRSHPIHPENRTRTRGHGVHALLTLQQLAREAHVGVRYATRDLDIVKGVLEALAFPPHEIRDDERGRARHALAAVDEHAPTLVPDILEVIEDVVENAGDVLRG